MSDARTTAEERQLAHLNTVTLADARWELLTRMTPIEIRMLGRTK